MSSQNTPDGAPVRIADGVGPAVSPDGRRLAFVAEVVLHVRDVDGGADWTFPEAVGELGGSDTAWSPDGRHVASPATPPTASAVLVDNHRFRAASGRNRDIPNIVPKARPARTAKELHRQGPFPSEECTPR